MSRSTLYIAVCSVESNEREVNEILKGIYPDFASLRRYLIEYGFFERTRDGSAYWRHPG